MTTPKTNAVPLPLQRVISNMGAADNDADALDLLLVEDSYADMLTTLRAINDANLPYKLNLITNGDDVIPYLMNAVQERMPDLILLDMGLPGTDGFEILESLSALPALLRAVPIAIITKYTDFNYLDKTYELPIYGFLTKPVDHAKMREILARVYGFADVCVN